MKVTHIKFLVISLASVLDSCAATPKTVEERVIERLICHTFEHGLSQGPLDEFKGL